MKKEPEEKPKRAKKQKKAKKVGRPTKYKRKYCKALVDFFDVEAYDLITLETMTEYNRDRSIKKILEKKKPIAKKLPTLYRFAEKIGVEKGTLYDWKEKYPEFKHAFTRAEELTKEFLTTLGLSGIAPPASFIFVASNMTDMRSRGVSADELPAGSFMIPVIIRKGEERPALPEPRETVKVRVHEAQYEEKR